jgi:predicted Holliday junction resolvase-like endonuclease
MSDGKDTRDAKNIIQFLKSKNVSIKCPVCEQQISAAKAGLFYLEDFTHNAAELYRQKQDELKDRADELKKMRKKIPEMSQKGAKAVNLGFILERLAPSMKTFRFEHNDCRSLFDPIDYVIFDGLSQKGQVERIVFSDIKTGKASLETKQKQIKALVEGKKVDMDIYDPEAGSAK